MSKAPVSHAPGWLEKWKRRFPVTINDPEQQYRLDNLGHTRWARMDAKLFARCPQCGAEPGFHCFSHENYMKRKMHPVRVDALREMIGKEEFHRRYRLGPDSGFSFGEVKQEIEINVDG